MAEFEFDPYKSVANLVRHGVDFIDAQELWDRAHVIVPARLVGEPRYAILAKLDGRVYVAVFTMRGTTIRIMSCHRADRKRTRIYEESLQENKKS